MVSFRIMNDERCEHMLERAGLEFGRDGRGLFLSDGNMTVRADFAHMAARVRAGNLERELLVRAARVKGASDPLAVDATAGLGEDSLLLAAAGFRVLLFERNPVIAALLADAIGRAAADAAISPIVARMRLVEGDSVEGLGGLDERPDVVLLDPMFPSKRKGALVKKKLQLLQRLEQPCDDETALLEASFDAQPRKVVVKRPAKGPHLAGREPDYSIAGKAVRYDCYAFAR